MADLKTQNTSYPTSIDTATLINDVTDDEVAAHVNGPVSAILAIQNEIGVGLKGTDTTLVARLARNIHADGGVLRGTTFPVSPPNLPHYFWRTDEKRLYLYDNSIAQYQRIDSTNVHANLAALSADDHTQYVHNTTARTITAQHTFSPASPQPPFVLAANAQGQKVVGLDAETVDGKNPGGASGLATLNASSLLEQNAPSGFLINSQTAWHAGNDGLTSGLIAQTAASVTEGSDVIHTKIIDIGDWNMDTTANVSVAHGVSFGKIRAVKVAIRRDDQAMSDLISYYQDSTNVAGNFLVDTTNVTLARTTGGSYDNASYDSTSYNRGWVTITYVE